MAPSILKELTTGEAYKKAVNLGSSGIIKELKDSALKGRGGAGFPTGLKWEFAKNAQGIKYVVCNADEGEVGTFKDRKLLVEYPEKLFEGMAIAALALAAKKAIIYLRWEYSDIKGLLEEVIAKTKSTFDKIDFEIRMGAGAYVCGEETALLESLGGDRGEARNKPPYPVTNGYLDSPTVINNVETFCCVPHIILEGAKEFASVGTENSKGPKLFSISGDVSKPGVYEFPLGTPLKKVLTAAGAKKYKAVLVGGASGVCIGAKDANRKLAFEDLPPGGAIVVFNKKRKMLEVLENLMDFFVEESCGQCVPCREGTYRLLNFIKKMKAEKVITDKELGRYLDLGDSMKNASKCGLGQSAPNPFLSIMENFKNEIVKVEKVKTSIAKGCKH